MLKTFIYGYRKIVLRVYVDVNAVRYLLYLSSGKVG
jgi:hypothetical protein